MLPPHKRSSRIEENSRRARGGVKEAENPAIQSQKPSSPAADRGVKVKRHLPNNECRRGEIAALTMTVGLARLYGCRAGDQDLSVDHNISLVLAIPWR